MCSALFLKTFYLLSFCCEESEVSALETGSPASQALVTVVQNTKAERRLPMPLIYFRFQLLGRKAQKNSWRLEVGGALPPSDVDTLTHTLTGNVVLSSFF